MITKLTKNLVTIGLVGVVAFSGGYIVAKMGERSADVSVVAAANETDLKSGLDNQQDNVTDTSSNRSSAKVPQTNIAEGEAPSLADQPQVDTLANGPAANMQNVQSTRSQAYLRKRLKFEKDIQRLGLRDSDNPSGVAGHVAESFKAEAVDRSWAYDYETALYNTLASDPTLSLLPVESVECRTSRCKVSLSVNGQDQVTEASRALMNALVLGKGGLNYGQIIGDYQPGSETATWFIGRDKTTDMLGNYKKSNNKRQQTRQPGVRKSRPIYLSRQSRLRQECCQVCLTFGQDCI